MIIIATLVLRFLSQRAIGFSSKINLRKQCRLALGMTFLNFFSNFFDKDTQPGLKQRIYPQFALPSEHTLFQ